MVRRPREAVGAGSRVDGRFDTSDAARDVLLVRFVEVDVNDALITGVYYPEVDEYKFNRCYLLL